MPGHIGVETYTFEEHDGKTTLTTTSVFDTIEDRDGVLESGDGVWCRRDAGPARRVARCA